MRDIQYRKALPVLGAYDVIVAGAGPAGICAAVAAARMGAKTVLVERYGTVGGNLTVGYVGPILGMVGKGTMRDEIVSLLGVPNNDMIGEVGVAHDIEKAKIALTEFVSHENLTVYLQTPVADVIKEGDAVTGIAVLTKDGLKVIEGKTIIDCTGDGDVAFFAGAEYQKGREDGLMQPVTLEFKIDHVDESRAIVCIGDVDEVELNGQRFLDYCKECAEEGLLPENLAAVRLHRTSVPGERQVNTTQVNRIDSTDPSQLYKAEKELRNQIEILIDFFRTYLPGYENCQLKSSGDTLGVRESRRIMGKHIVTAEELASGVRFQDVAVHKAEFIVDIHNPDGAGQAEEKIQYVIPYDLPYRCFVPKETENLLVAGRCISGTHRAHASYRVMSICMAMGQACGTAAALCAAKTITPADLDVAELQDALTAQGVELFD